MAAKKTKTKAEAPSTIVTLSGRRPDITDTYRWADFVELRALVAQDGLVARADLADERKDSGTSNRGEHESAAEGSDECAAWTADVFSFLRSRANFWGASYPFEIRHNDLQVRQPLEPRHDLYVFCLLAANLQQISKSRHHLFTGGFEALSKTVLARLLPGTSQVRRFGAADADYQGNIGERITKLAADLKVQPTAGNEVSLNRRKTGDLGIDLVAWTPFGTLDPEGAFPTYFGQAACSPDEWPMKQNTVSPGNISAVLNIDGINSLCFIPQAFRNSDGKWFDSLTRSANTILIDRLRFTHVLDQAWIPDAETKTLIDKAVGEKRLWH